MNGKYLYQTLEGADKTANTKPARRPQLSRGDRAGQNAVTSTVQKEPANGNTNRSKSSLSGRGTKDIGTPNPGAIQMISTATDDLSKKRGNTFTKFKNPQLLQNSDDRQKNKNSTYRKRLNVGNLDKSSNHAATSIGNKLGRDTSSNGFTNNQTSQLNLANRRGTTPIIKDLNPTFSIQDTNSAGENNSPQPSKAGETSKAKANIMPAPTGVSPGRVTLSRL